MHMAITWNSNLIFTSDIATNEVYPDGSYNQTIKWYMGSFAPAGHYNAYIKMHGLSSIANGTLACLEADWDM